MLGLEYAKKRVAAIQKERSKGGGSTEKESSKGREGRVKTSKEKVRR